MSKKNNQLLENIIRELQKVKGKNQEKVNQIIEKIRLVVSDKKNKADEAIKRKCELEKGRHRFKKMSKFLTAGVAFLILFNVGKELQVYDNDLPNMSQFNKAIQELELDSEIMGIVNNALEVCDSKLSLPGEVKRSSYTVNRYVFPQDGKVNVNVYIDQDKLTENDKMAFRIAINEMNTAIQLVKPNCEFVLNLNPKISDNNIYCFNIYANSLKEVNVLGEIINPAGQYHLSFPMLTKNGMAKYGAAVSIDDDNLGTGSYNDMMELCSIIVHEVFGHGILDMGDSYYFNNFKNKTMMNGIQTDIIFSDYDLKMLMAVYGENITIEQANMLIEQYEIKSIFTQYKVVILDKLKEYISSQESAFGYDSSKIELEYSDDVHYLKDNGATQSLHKISGKELKKTTMTFNTLDLQNANITEESFKSGYFVRKEGGNASYVEDQCIYCKCGENLFVVEYDAENGDFRKLNDYILLSEDEYNKKLEEFSTKIEKCKTIKEDINEKAIEKIKKICEGRNLTIETIDKFKENSFIIKKDDEKFVSLQFFDGFDNPLYNELNASKNSYNAKISDNICMFSNGEFFVKVVDNETNEKHYLLFVGEVDFENSNFKLTNVYENIDEKEYNNYLTAKRVEKVLQENKEENHLGIENFDLSKVSLDVPEQLYCVKIGKKNSKDYLEIKGDSIKDIQFYFDFKSIDDCTMSRIKSTDLLKEKTSGILIKSDGNVFIVYKDDKKNKLLELAYRYETFSYELVNSYDILEKEEFTSNLKNDEKIFSSIKSKKMDAVDKIITEQLRDDGRKVDSIEDVQSINFKNEKSGNESYYKYSFDNQSRKVIVERFQNGEAIQRNEFDLNCKNGIYYSDVGNFVKSGDECLLLSLSYENGKLIPTIKSSSSNFELSNMNELQ